MNVNTTSAFLSKDVWCWWLTGTLSGLWNCTDVFKTFFQNWKNTTFYVFLIVAPFSRTLIRSLGDAAIATSSVATRCALRQAMKLGIPVIARNNAAYSAIIEHRSNGLLFAVPDVRMNNVGVRFLFTITTKTTNSSFAICYLIVSALTLTSSEMHTRYELATIYYPYNSLFRQSVIFISPQTIGPVQTLRSSFTVSPKRPPLIFRITAKTTRN